MTQGIRCDGCLAMVFTGVNDSYLELDTMLREDAEHSYPRSQSEQQRHFHNIACLKTWAEKEAGTA